MSGGMNTAFVDDPMEFMKTYPIAPPDDVARYRGKVKTEMANTASNDGYEFSRMPSSRKVAWINFMKVPKMASANTVFMPMSEGAVSFAGSYTKLGKRHVPVYFLPWSAGGAIIRLTIPRLTAIAADQLDSPYFFTATITGCSIFIKGDPDHPTIYHAGGETGEDDPVNAARFWSDLMTQHSTRHGAIQTKVDKTDYIRSPNARGGRTTQHAILFESWLENNRRPELDVQFVEPWGCVLGLRDAGGNWAFYLQENATVFFYKVKRERGGDVRVGNIRSMARPVAVRQIFPGAHPTLMNITPMPRVS